MFYNTACFDILFGALFNRDKLRLVSIQREENVYCTMHVVWANYPITQLATRKPSMLGLVFINMTLGHFCPSFLNKSRTLKNVERLAVTPFWVCHVRHGSSPGIINFSEWMVFHCDKFQLSGK